MKPVSVLLWELSEKDMTTLPEGFPVLRYDTLTESLTVLHAGMSRYLKDKRYVYLVYRLPSVIPENGDGEILQPYGSAGEDPRIRGEVRA